LSETEGKLVAKITRPDGTVVEVPVTSEQVNRFLTTVSGNPKAVISEPRQKHKSSGGKISDEKFPTDEEVKDFMKDGDKTIHEIAQHFLGRTINAKVDTRAYHRLYNQKARVLGKTH